MNADPYYEEIRSTKTSVIFLGLSIVFLGIFIWRVLAVGFRANLAVSIISLFFSIFFGLYVLNYRTLKITITNEVLSLKFGILRWRTKIDNIAASTLDDSPLWIKMGGAGVHFALVDGKYRAFYNFLEYPRVLITFKQKRGPVQELVFTTRKPDQILDFVNERVSTS